MNPWRSKGFQGAVNTRVLRDLKMNLQYKFNLLISQRIKGGWVWESLGCMPINRVPKGCFGVNWRNRWALLLRNVTYSRDLTVTCLPSNFMADAVLFVGSSNELMSVSVYTIITLTNGGVANLDVVYRGGCINSPRQWYAKMLAGIPHFRHTTTLQRSKFEHVMSALPEAGVKTSAFLGCRKQSWLKVTAVLANTEAPSGQASESPDSTTGMQLLL